MISEYNFGDGMGVSSNDITPTTNLTITGCTSRYNIDDPGQLNGSGMKLFFVHDS